MDGPAAPLVPPDWVPDAVGAMASAMAARGHYDMSYRLLTDVRMRNVWRELTKPRTKTILKYEFIERLHSYQRLNTWDISNDGVTSIDIACAALFSFAVHEFSTNHTIETQSDLSVESKRILDAADICREIQNNYILKEMDSSLHNSYNETIESLIDVAGWIKNKDGPLVLGRSSKLRGDDDLRARTRLLAAEMHKIFGTYRYGTVATIANVAMNPASPVTAESVRNWTSDLGA